MGAYTRYLAVVCQAANTFAVRVFEGAPIDFAQEAMQQGCDLRYSPVLPAFLSPKEGPPPIPSSLTSIGFLFSSAPFKALGALKAELKGSDRPLLYFTEGLASIVLLNFSFARVQELSASTGACPLEWWPLDGGRLKTNQIQIESPTPSTLRTPRKKA